MYPYPCPFCQQRLLASPERVGQRTICPKCLNAIRIPPPEIPDEGRVSVPELLGDTSASNIFSDDPPGEEVASEEVDGMNLDMPGSGDEYESILGDSGMPLGASLPPSLETPESSQAAPIGTGAIAQAAAPRLGPWPLAAVGAEARPTTKPQDTPAQGHTGIPTPRDSSLTVLNPLGPESADIAAELSTALTLRMKPPPEPPGDLRLSTGFGLSLILGGLILWILSMMRLADETSEQLLQAVGGIGLLLIAAAYIWLVFDTSRFGKLNGFATMLPPVWLYRLVHPLPGPAGYRPLALTIAGMLLLALALTGNSLRPAIQALIGEPEAPYVILPQPSNTPLARIKAAASEGIDRRLIEALGELSQGTAPEGSNDFTELLAELQRLRQHESGEVRAAALLALKRLAGLQAVRTHILQLLSDPQADLSERRAALDIAREFKDREIARGVVNCLGYRGFLDDTDHRAAETLRAMGPPEAEEALLEAFQNEDSVLRGVPHLLAEIGTARAIERLRIVAETAPARDLRQQATRTIEKIQARISSP